MELFEYQKAHTDRLQSIFDRSLIALDTSPVGAGKTYTSTYLAMTNRLPMLVIGPKTMEDAWVSIAKECDVPIISYLSYQTLRSVKNKQPKHGLLTRHDLENDSVYFSPTAEYEKWVEHGVLLVMDEIQMIKNKSDQYQACQALCSTILQKGGQSRILLLSGSPFDKEEHALNLLRLAGFIRNPTLCRFHKQTGRVELLGMQELIQKCQKIDPIRTATIQQNYVLTQSKMYSYMFRLFIEVIRPSILSQMPLPPIEVEKDVKNAYYQMKKDDQTMLRDAIGQLATASRYNKYTDASELREGDWGAITKALLAIEQAKLPILIEQVRKVLEENRDNKVVVFVQFTSTIESLRDALNDYKPVLLYGQTSSKDRKRVIDSFQTEKSTRCMIGNLRVGGVGISLHDTVGDAPRHLFVVPTYSLLDLHQATGRIYRQNTRSKATIRFVYGYDDKVQEGIRETQLLNALARKTKVIKEILDIHNDSILFPGDYPSLYV